MLCFVLLNSILLNILCVQINSVLFQGQSQACAESKPTPKPLSSDWNKSTIPKSFRLKTCRSSSPRLTNGNQTAEGMAYCPVEG